MSGPPMTHVVVGHHFGPTGRVVEFHAPRITSQALPGVMLVDLYDEANVLDGYAKFTSGMFLLAGTAIGQYLPLSAPGVGRG